MIPYDASREALYQPSERPTLFRAGQPVERLPLALEAARLAYERDAQRLKAAMALVGFSIVEPFSVGSTQAFGAYCPSDRTALVAFRGTEANDPTDLATDADTRPVAWTGIQAPGKVRVHAGFAAAATSVQPLIETWLKDTCPDRACLLMSGHSLGAALATLLATAWRPTLLVTMGSPRVGNGEFAALLDGVDMVRVVDCCDVITEVPPEALGFVHVGPALYLDREAGQHKAPPDDVVAADRFKARIGYFAEHTWRWGRVSVRDLADHAPINYLRAFFP